MGSFLNLGGGLRAGFAAAGTGTLAWCAPADAILATTTADGLLGALDLLRWVDSLAWVVTLTTLGTCALSWSTSADTFGTTTAADSLAWLASNSVWLLRALVQTCQPPCLVVDICHLLLANNVEVSELLTSRCTHCLLEVAVEATPSIHGFIGDLVLVIHLFGLVSHLVLAVEVLQSRGESTAEAMLVVECDGLLNDVIREGIAVSKILGDDSGSWLVLLRDVVLRSLSGTGRGRTRLCGDLIYCRCGRNMYL